MKRLILVVAVSLGLTACEPATQPDPRLGTSFAFTGPPDTTFTVVNTLDGGLGSLRQAILDANARVGFEAIHFAIPAASDPGCNAGTGVCTITPVSELPAITDVVVIDGYTQPGSSANTNAIPAGLNTVLTIELDGSAAGSTASGLIVLAGQSTVKGLAVNRFGLAGLLLNTNDSNAVEGNFLGTDPTGTAALGNGRASIAIFGGSDNVIGGTSVAASNLISGNPSGDVNNGNGIEVHTDGHRIHGNLIGTNAAGTGALPNQRGLLIFGSGVQVGGVVAGAGNVISGNDERGIFAVGANTIIEGNFIGTDAAGGAPLGNGSHGIQTQGPNNVIGGTAGGAGNVISGNGQYGILICGAQAGTQVLGNLLGTDATGNTAIGNDRGVFVCSGPTATTIGGVTASARNVVSGNAVGIDIRGSQTTVQGNFIGTKANGTEALPNTFWGMLFQDAAQNNTVGGTAAGAGNLISGNPTGVVLNGASVTGNVLLGNFIGTDATGTGPLANQTGVHLTQDAHDNTVGGRGSAPATSSRSTAFTACG